MRLIIKNLAKIKDADIVVDGITVLAGKNNTGKSTIGKVLYSVFNSLHDIDSKIESQREDEITYICNRYIRNMYMHSPKQDYKGPDKQIALRRVYDRISKELAKEIFEIDADALNEELYKALYKEVFEKYELIVDEEQIIDYVDSTYEQVLSRKKNESYKIALELIGRYFAQVFSSQIQCLMQPEASAEISLIIKQKETSIKFKGNECVSWETGNNILHKAFFIDDPFVIDDVSEYLFPMVSNKGIRRDLIQTLSEAEDNIMEGLFDAISAKENLREIYDILDRVAEGDISLQNNQWGFSSEQFSESVHFENLSAGLKSFVLIRLLLEKGALKEKDVLILDEPEIHLHPEWQLLYAEIIVLLQKKFDMSIVVTTHSAHFLEAIEYFSKKHKWSHKCNYYISDIQNGLAVFENVTESLDKIYKQMVTPSMLLDTLKYEMGNEDE